MLTFLGKQLGRLSKSEKDGLVRKDGDIWRIEERGYQ